MADVDSRHARQPCRNHRPADEIRAKAEQLGKEHEKFAESIAEAEVKLESARVVS